MKPQNNFRKIPTWLAAAALLLIGGWGLIDQAVEAGPITGTPTSPATKLAVYQGVISLYPGTGNIMMEIGNQGQEFIATSTIFLRPRRLTAANGLQVLRDSLSGKVQLRVQGRLCLGGVCKNVWPDSSGATFWQTAGTQITPATDTHGLYTPGANTGYGDLQFYGRSPDTALYIRNSNLAANAYALEVQGARIYGDLEVNGQIDISKNVWNGSAWVVETGKVWHPGNDGAGSGMDADWLDGFDVYFERRPANFGIECSRETTAGNTWCVCADFDFPGSGRKCLDLR